MKPIVIGLRILLVLASVGMFVTFFTAVTAGKRVAWTAGMRGDYIGFLSSHEHKEPAALSPKLNYSDLIGWTEFNTKEYQEFVDYAFFTCGFLVLYSLVMLGLARRVSRQITPPRTD